MLVEQSVVCPVLVGRDAPLSAGWHALDRARDAHGGTLLVSGEAGIGKSRLVRAMVERARALGFVALQGACFEADRAHPYAPVLDLVRTLAATRVAGARRALLRGRRDELVTLFPELRVDLSGRARRARRSIRKRIGAGSSTRSPKRCARSASVQPRARSSSRTCTGATTRRSTSCSTSRARIGARAHRARPDVPQRRGRPAPRPPARRLRSRALRVRSRASSARRARGRGDAARDLRRAGGVRIAVRRTRCTGSPKAIRSSSRRCSRRWSSPAISCSTDGAWRARPLEHVRVPRTATEAVGRRLAGLSEAAREVASVAAVAGRRFDFALLQALTQARRAASCSSLVKELVDAQLVVEESADRFAFRHALTREAMRARLLVRERVALHRAIAAALEQRLRRQARTTATTRSRITRSRRATGTPPDAMRCAPPSDALAPVRPARSAPALRARRSRRRENAGQRSRRRAAHRPRAGARNARRVPAGATTISPRRSRGRARAAIAAPNGRRCTRSGMLWAARDYDRAGEYRRDALDVARAIGDPPLDRAQPEPRRQLVSSTARTRSREFRITTRRSRSSSARATSAASPRRSICSRWRITSPARRTRRWRLYERSIELFTALDDRRGLANALSVLARVRAEPPRVAPGRCATSAITAELLVERARRASRRRDRLARGRGIRALPARRLPRLARRIRARAAPRARVARHRARRSSIASGSAARAACSA